MVPNWSLQSNNLCQSITLGHSKGKSLLCASCLLFHLSTTDMTLRCWCSSAAFTTWPGHWGSLGITNWWLDKPSPGRLGRIISELRKRICHPMSGWHVSWTTLALPCKYFCGFFRQCISMHFVGALAGNPHDFRPDTSGAEKRRINWADYVRNVLEKSMCIVILREVQAWN